MIEETRVIEGARADGAGRAEAIVAGLRSRCPELELLTASTAVEPYRHDETEYLQPGIPLAVAFPASTDEVVGLVRYAGEHRIPLVPRGAGSGLSGGATAIDGAITVVMTKMNRILEIDRANLAAVVQPGVITADLGQAAAAAALFYAPDPGSAAYCTIGGNLAENAGGLRCLKYGVTRDWVLGLEVVLADGTVIRTGGKTVKEVAGYDLSHWFIGSEGTLGIITEATVRLRPAPGPVLTLLAFFPTVHAAGEAVARMTELGLTPVTLELMDQFAIRAVDDAQRLHLDRDAGAMLLIESDAGAAADDELDRASAACEAAGARTIVRAADPAEADRLREARRQAHWSLGQSGAARMDDIGVPRSAIPELLAAIDRISETHQLRVGVFGHAGDGNLHPTFVVDREDPTAEQRINQARAAIYAEVVALGGTISGEHGIGVSKRRYLELQRGPDAIRVMRAIKAALDPLGLLNPGRIFSLDPTAAE